MFPNLDQNALRQRLNRIASEYEQHANVAKIIGARLLEQLDLIKLKPLRILELGCRTGIFTRQLTERYPDAHIIGVDISEGMIQLANHTKTNRLCFHCGTFEDLVLETNSADLILSNLSFCYENDLSFILKCCFQHLKPEGLLLFSTFGPDTLKELRHSWQSIDEHAHIHDFMDMHDIGDQLLSLAFEDPVVNREDLIVYYENSLNLMYSLKLEGMSNIRCDRFKGLMRKNSLQTLHRVYQQQYQTKVNKLPATYEIIYGYALKPKKISQRQLAENKVGVSIEPLKREPGLG